MDKTEKTEKTARVIEVRKNSFIIDLDGRELSAKLRGSFYEGPADGLPVVGDYVTVLYNPAGDSVIQAVHERKSLLRRPDQARTGVMQNMVANADYCFIITSFNEDYSYNRIARYASVALQGGSVPVAILTKADLCQDADKYVHEVETISDQIRVHAVSALQGAGLRELEAYFTPGTTVCLMGSSGAGKSTLINALAGEEIMRTGGVRASDSAGRHTTTHRQLIQLKNGVSIIDTPGMREIGMASAEAGIDHTFADIAALEGKCKFRNCRHETEPGCAIKAAIQRGELTRERWALYCGLSQENVNNRAKKKKISQFAKEYKKLHTK